MSKKRWIAQRVHQMSEIFRKTPPPIGMNWQLHKGPGIFFGFFWAVLFCSLICFCAFFFRNGKFAKGAVSIGLYVVDTCCKILLMDW